MYNLCLHSIVAFLGLILVAKENDIVDFILLDYVYWCTHTHVLVDRHDYARFYKCHLCFVLKLRYIWLLFVHTYRLPLRFAKLNFYSKLWMVKPFGVMLFWIFGKSAIHAIVVFLVKFLVCIDLDWVECGGKKEIVEAESFS